MAFDEDLSVFFDTELGAAVPAIYKGKTIPVIFNRPFLLEDGEVASIASSKPEATCRAADVSDARQGDRITIEGVTYKVVLPMPDATGITVLSLQV